MREIDIPSDVPEEILIGFARCHQLETWLREMIYLETKAQYGTVYWSECESALNRAGARGIPPDRSRQRDQRHPHMATAETDPLWFISFDSLLRVLFDAQLWPLFEPYLTTKNLLEAKLEEVAIIRNRVAHTRGLHMHDIERLLLILRELDQGFFRFCASYGDRYRFDEAQQRDPVYQHYIGAHPWHERPRTTCLDLQYTIRPSAKWDEAWESGRGKLYTYAIYTPHERRQHLDYGELLRFTADCHQNVAHIILDSDQCWLYVTIPAVLPSEVVTNTVERFYRVCTNSYGRFLPDMIRFPDKQEGENELAYEHRKIAAINKVLENIALEWPHYVIAPSHAYAILDSSCTPCTMFSA